ncbi:MAG: flagellar biosynthesis protein FlgE [Myxococcales bacterium]|nr:flagellar biosynthesis protein FlgE [Myxococcales bacterium]
MVSNTMYAGLSGLSSNSTAITVIGDNIANVNTIGFRRSRTMFEDVLTRSVLGMGQLGGGTAVSRIDKVFTQGSLSASVRSTDLAISGRGLFVLFGKHDGIANYYFTRAGGFNVDKDGFIVNPEGLRLQGYDADPAGNILGALTDLTVDPPVVPPQATGNININVNLDPTTAPSALPFDPLNAAGTSEFSSSVPIFDSLGNQHDATVFFKRTLAGWDYFTLVDGSEVVGGIPGDPTITLSGSLQFTTNGELLTHTPLTTTVDFLGATPGQSIAINFGDEVSLGGTGLQGTTGFASPFVINALTQDGHPPGDLVDVSVAGDGIVTGHYTNGFALVLGQVALGDFRDLQGLERVGGSLFLATPDAGEPLIGFPGTGGRGSVEGGALEASNVDISEEFVSLIVHQRGFQANTRTITTADEMIQETLALKR